MPTAENTYKPEVRVSPRAYVALLLGWFIPGAGHAYQGRWIRAALLFTSVVAMFALGLGMNGRIYTANTGDLLDILGFIGDLGTGALYFLARAMNWGGGAIQLATADYGTKFIVVGGLLNVVSAIDAYDIAIGKKN
jgi:hypothetical protein